MPYTKNPYSIIEWHFYIGNKQFYPDDFSYNFSPGDLEINLITDYPLNINKSNLKIKVVSYDDYFYLSEKIFIKSITIYNEDIYV